MTDGHARLSPSSAARWMNCPGSVQLQEKYPKPDDSTDADEGNTAHALAHMLLRPNDTVAVDIKGVTPEIADGVDVYVEVVTKICGGSPQFVEQQVGIFEGCWGTLDAGHFNEVTGCLHIFDLKFGWGVVEIFRNWQLKLYAIGLAKKLGIEPLNVVLHIIQPRPYHTDGPHRIHKLPGSRLKEIVAIAQISGNAALGPNPHCLTGTWCKYCSALLNCDTVSRATYNVIDEALMPVTHRPTSPEGLGYELTMLRRAAEIIKHRLTASEATVLSMIQSGTLVPGWSVGFTGGRTEWELDKSAEIIAAADMMGITVTKPALITPTQAAKAGFPKDLYTVKKPGSAKLEPINQEKIKEMLK